MVGNRIIDVKFLSIAILRAEPGELTASRSIGVLTIVN